MVCKLKESTNKFYGLIPSDWDEGVFQYVFSTSKGLSITKENLEEEGIPVINYGEIHSKYGVFVNAKTDELPFVSKNYLKRNHQALLNEGCFVFADTSEDLQGSGNFTTILGDEQVFAGYHTVIARPKKEIITKYFSYLFDSIAFRNQIRSSVSGVKVYSITQAILKKTKLLIPSLQEQEAIANFLDEKIGVINKSIEEIRIQIDKLNKYKESFITQVISKGIQSHKYKPAKTKWFGEIPVEWDESVFQYFFSTLKGLSITKENLEEEGIPVINYGEIHSKYGVFVNVSTDELPFVSPKYLKRNHHALLNEGCFVFADTSEDMEGSGNFTTILGDEQVFAGYHTIIARPKKEIITKYFSYLFDSTAFRNQIRSSVSGVKVYSITQAILKKTKLLIPPLDEQRQIAQFLDKKVGDINNIIDLKSKQLETLQELKKSLIYNYTTGKKRVPGFENS